jgi:hypothetical protein
MFLQDVGVYQRVYTASQPRTSSRSPPWKPKISHNFYFIISPQLLKFHTFPRLIIVHLFILRILLLMLVSRHVHELLVLGSWNVNTFDFCLSIIPVACACRSETCSGNLQATSDVATYLPSVSDWGVFLDLRFPLSGLLTNLYLFTMVPTNEFTLVSVSGNLVFEEYFHL